MSTGALPFLTAADIGALATGADAAGFLADALRSGQVDPESDSPRLFSPAPGGEFLIMPTSGEQWSGVKLVTVAPDNPQRGKPKIQGLYALFASADLAPVLLLDGSELTLMRTAATTVLAVERLLAAGPPAPDGPLPVVVFGTGPQAARHLRYLAELVGPVDAVVVGRRAESAQRFVAEFQGRAVTAWAGSAKDVRDAAVVICVTSSTGPVVPDDLVPGDAVLAAVGAHGLDKAELPPELIRRSDVVVEGRGSAMRESGNLLGARSEQEWASERVANLAELVRGEVVRRPGHPAVYSGVGMAWEDLVVATALAQRHRAHVADELGGNQPG